MKKIYTVTLEDDDIPLQHNISSDIREIAYWVYAELGKFDKQILCIDNDRELNANGLIKNELYDIATKEGYIYKFDSDLKNVDSRLFEPFILGAKTFGFTVYEDSISDSELCIIIDNILKLLRMNYKYSVSSILYDDKNIKNRFKAIDRIMNTENSNSDVKKRVKLPIKSLVSTIGLW